jgi:hypothetical protein
MPLLCLLGVAAGVAMLIHVLVGHLVGWRDFEISGSPLR